MKKKQLPYYLLFSLLLLFCFSCGEVEPIVLPSKPAPHLNVKDSLAIVDIFNQADGKNWFIKWDLKNMYTWGGAGVALDTVRNEYRIVQLYINVPPVDKVNGTVSPRIGDLEELRFLEITGLGIHGDFPVNITKLKHLQTIWIAVTSISGTLPKELFLLKNLTLLDISGNQYITGEIPEEIAQLPPSLERCMLEGNNLYGRVPDNIRLHVNLELNNLTEIPFKYFEKDAPFINVRYNRMSGTIPDFILNNEYSLKKLRSNAIPQQKGFGFSNIPLEEKE